MNLRCGKQHLDLTHFQVMGVLNVTPDSFSDGGRYVSLDAALQQAEAMLLAGATLIDVGGESTRPGAAPVSVQQELDRVCPVVDALCRRFDVIVSVDTSTPAVMRDAIALGAGMINDVRAFQREGAVQAVASSQDVALCVMHMQGQPDTMQQAPTYRSVVAEVNDFFRMRVDALRSAGVAATRLVLDPGFGFGKTLEHNYELLANLPMFQAYGFPLLVGVSRKSMIGQVLDKPVDQRLAGSLAAAVLAAERGARIFRVHDVAETVDALRIVEKMQATQRSQAS